MAGRPSRYTAEIAEEICRRLSHGESLRSVCRDEHMPPEPSVRNWVLDDRKGFAAQYARARDFGADAMADELLEIVDDGSNDWMDRRRPDGGVDRVLDYEHVQRSKLRADNRRWLMAKMAPKRYGDKTAVELSGPGSSPIQSVGINTSDPAEASRIYQQLITGK